MIKARALSKTKLLLLPLLVILLLVLAVEPVSAVANPDNIALYTCKAFQNIFEADDILFVVSYKVGYTSEPTEPAQDTFQVAIYNTDNSTLIQPRALNEYQYNVHSIYFNATAAASLVWGAEYNVRVMGNPAFFAPIEDVTMDTMKLSPDANWISGTATTSKVLLKDHCLDLAQDLELAWGLPLTTATPDGDVLNSTGRLTFLAAIPRLDWAVPDLFQVVVSAMSIGQQERTAAYETTTSVATQLGAATKSAFDGIGDYLNVSGQTVAAIWIMLFVLIVASIVFLNSGNTTAAMVLALPILLIGGWTGALPLAVLFSIGVIVVVLMGHFIWLRGM